MQITDISLNEVGHIRCLLSGRYDIILRDMTNI
jgi:hypothetical protein